VIFSHAAYFFSNPLTALLNQDTASARRTFW
jgi:hypothetical protein